MYEVLFYETSRGESPVYDYLKELEEKQQTNKNARIELSQILLYIELLQRNGTNNNANVTKRIDENLWELRPGSNRILYFYNDGKTFILLHLFRKKTQKTPIREINKAKNEITDYLKRRTKL